MEKENIYLVESDKAHDKRGRRWFFQVILEGYPDPSWEPLENLTLRGRLNEKLKAYVDEDRSQGRLQEELQWVLQEVSQGACGHVHVAGGGVEMATPSAMQDTRNEVLRSSGHFRLGLRRLGFTCNSQDFPHTLALGPPSQRGKLGSAALLLTWLVGSCFLNSALLFLVG